MTNRRHLEARKKKRAPADPMTPGEEAQTALRSRGGWHLVLTSLKVLLGVGLIFGAAAGISWGVFRYAKTTPRFSVEKIEIEGTKRLSQADILAASGLSPGENLFSLDIDAAQKALADSPWIARARVTRRLPDEVFIEIHERQARATLVLLGKSYLVDENGEPFKEAGLGDPHDLPLMTGIELSALRENPSLEHERMADLLALVRSYEHLSIAKNFPVEEVHVDAAGHATLMVGTSGIALHLGPPPFKQRLLRAERVLKKTLQGGATPSVVFLDNEAHPERVVVRLE